MLFACQHSDFVTASSEFSGDGLFGCELEFRLESYSDLLFNDYSIYLPEYIKRAVIKRKAEYLAGRLASKTCIYRHQRPVPTLDAFVLNVGSRGEPLWPENLLGSISHTFGRAKSVVVCNAKYLAVGIDIEHLIDLDRFYRIKLQFLSRKELQFLDVSDYPINIVGTIVFSAKESLFKALYPLVGEYFDFHDAEVVSIDMEGLVMNLQLLRTLSVDPLCQVGRRFKVRYVVSDACVYTELIIERSC